MADRDLGTEILDGLNEIKAFKKSIAQGLQEAIELNQGGKVAAHNHSVEISMPKQKLTEEQLKILHEIKHLIEIKDAGRNFTKKITEMDESIDIEKALFDEFGMKLGSVQNSVSPL